MVDLTTTFAADPAPVSLSATSRVVERSARQVARCEVVVAPPHEEDRFAEDLLPWADPYIASLMASLQREEAIA